MKKRIALMRGVAVFCTVSLLAAPAHANFLVAPIFGSWMMMALALIPIVIVETIVFMASGVRFWESLTAMSVGNLASTLAGLPLAYVMELSFAPRFGEMTGDEKPTIRKKLYLEKWILFIIFCFLMSWWIEAAVAVRFLNHLTPELVNESVFYANVASYSGLLLLLLVGMAGVALSEWGTKDLPDWNATVKARQLRNLMYRDELLGRQDRPVHEADLLEAWRNANRHAKQGIAFLIAAESRTDHRVSTDRDAAGFEKTTKRSSRAA